MKKNFETLEGGNIMKAEQDLRILQPAAQEPWKARNMPDLHDDRLQGFILTLF